MRDRVRVCVRDRKRVRGKAYKNFLVVGKDDGVRVRGESAG